MLPGFVQFSVAINARIIVFVNNLAWAKFILNTYTRDFNAVISNSGYNSLGGTFECVCYLFIDFFYSIITIISSSYRHKTKL